MGHLTHRIGILISFFILIAGLAGCGDSNVETIGRNEVATAKTALPPSHPEVTSGPTAAVAGVTWIIPSGWESGPQRPMRAATYWVGSGANRADCAVFFFGPGQGGSVQENIDRWIGQFTQPDGTDSQKKAAINKETIADLQVTTIDLTGTYMASMGGPMSSQKEERPNYRMIGAIIEAPQGPVFFKLTGQQDVVTAAEAEFRQLVQSVKKT
jgi:hypothetical protein